MTQHPQPPGRMTPGELAELHRAVRHGLPIAADAVERLLAEREEMVKALSRAIGSQLHWHECGYVGCEHLEEPCDCCPNHVDPLTEDELRELGALLTRVRAHDEEGG